MQGFQLPRVQICTRARPRKYTCIPSCTGSGINLPTLTVGAASSSGIPRKFGAFTADYVCEQFWNLIEEKVNQLNHIGAPQDFICALLNAAPRELFKLVWGRTKYSSCSFDCDYQKLEVLLAHLL